MLHSLHAHVSKSISSTSMNKQSDITRGQGQTVQVICLDACGDLDFSGLADGGDSPALDEECTRGDAAEGSYDIDVPDSERHGCYRVPLFFFTL